MEACDLRIQPHVCLNIDRDVFIYCSLVIWILAHVCQPEYMILKLGLRYQGR